MKKLRGMFHILLAVGSKVLSVLFLSFTIYLFLMLCCETIQKTELLRAANRMNLTNGIFYGNNDAWIMTEEEVNEEIKRIEGCEATGHVDQLFYMFECEADLVLIQNTAKDLSLYYSLESGAFFRKDDINKVLLPSRYCNAYKVGDTFTITAFDEARWIFTPLDLEVVGFLKDQPMITPFYGGNISLENLLSVEDAAVVSVLKESDGTVFPLTSNYSYMIYSKQGVNIDSFHEEISKIVDSPSNAIYGNTIISSYLTSHSEEFRDLTGLFFLSLLLGITFLWGRMLILKDSKEKTMAVHYLCGSTWRREIARLYLPVFIELLVSLLAGNLLYWYTDKQDPVPMALSPETDVLTILFVTAVLLLVYCIAILPVIFEAIRKSPIELYRED